MERLFLELPLALSNCSILAEIQSHENRNDLGLHSKSRTEFKPGRHNLAYTAPALQVLLENYASVYIVPESYDFACGLDSSSKHEERYEIPGICWTSSAHISQ